MIRSLVPSVSTARRSPMSPLAAWAASLAATAASTYALDLWAAAAGAGLVASGLLADLDHRSVVVFLLVTYTVWVFGLRANLRANGSLLAATGASTNVLSKLAYDITRRRWGDGRAARLAAAVAYTATEVAKEVPYYTAAFGAAAVTDSITTDDALVFLAGANLGAALYEAALARLTRSILRRPRSSGGSTVRRAPTTGGRSSATPCSARAIPVRPTTR
ncbi:hypothetical protein [Actinoplanes sp. GCM10030250]|uniref:hypothetical protein n=1 Tax=Actinoplanes sp. GCM10030250 TaxID=3273376 RepID=UPI003612B80B